MAGYDYFEQVRRQQQRATTLAGCLGCLWLLVVIGFWALVAAALIKFVFFGGF